MDLMDFVLLHDFDLCLYDLRLCLSAVRGPNQVTDFYKKTLKSAAEFAESIVYAALISDPLTKVTAL